MRADSTPGGNMSILTAYAASDSTPISTRSNLILIISIVLVFLVFCGEVYWTSRNKRWFDIIRKKRADLTLREENLSNRESELQQDKLMWEENLGRLVMENESLKEILEKIGKLKFDNTEDAATISEYIGIFKDFNTDGEYLTHIVHYGERRLEVVLHDLLQFKPEQKS